MFIFETRCRSLQENARLILIQPFPVRYRIQTSYNLDELLYMRGSHVMSTNECRLQELLHSSYYLLRQNIQNISWILQTLSFSDKREVPIKSCNIVLKKSPVSKRQEASPQFPSILSSVHSLSLPILNQEILQRNNLSSLV